MRHPPRAPRQRLARRRAGLTLLELLLVMAIIALVVGSSAGMFAGLDAGRRQAPGLVKSVLRQARSAAAARRAPALVRIDRAGGRLWSEGYQVIGTWRFEGDLTGAFGLDGGPTDARFVPDGHIGQALSFTDCPRATAAIAVAHDPAYDLAAGFVVECAVRWEAAGGGHVLRLGSSVSLAIGARGEVRAGFTPLVEVAGRRAGGSPVVVQSPPGALAPGRWARLCVAYDRARLVLSVDGVPLASLEEDAPVVPLGADGLLVLSDVRHVLPGSIDDLVVAARVAGDVAELPPDVRFGAGTPATVRFDGGGGLDRPQAGGPVAPVSVVLEYASGRSEAIVVGVWGTVP